MWCKLDHGYSIVVQHFAGESVTRCAWGHQSRVSYHDQRLIVRHHMILALSYFLLK